MRIEMEDTSMFEVGMKIRMGDAAQLFEVTVVEDDYIEVLPVAATAH